MNGFFMDGPTRGGECCVAATIGEVLSNLLVFKARRRYVERERPQALYDAVVEELAQLAPPWGLQGVPRLPLKEHKGGAAFGVNYRMVEKSSPVRNMTIGFMNRQPNALPTDESTNDDTTGSGVFFPQGYLRLALFVGRCVSRLHRCNPSLHWAPVRQRHFCCRRSQL